MSLRNALGTQKFQQKRLRFLSLSPSFFNGPHNEGVVAMRQVKDQTTRPMLDLLTKLSLEQE